MSSPATQASTRLSMLLKSAPISMCPGAAVIIAAAAVADDGQRLLDRALSHAA